MVVIIIFLFLIFVGKFYFLKVLFNVLLLLLKSGVGGGG